MISLVVFLVGASSIVSSLAGRVRGSRTSAVRILLRVLVILTGCVLAARPLHVGAVGVLINAFLRVLRRSHCARKGGAAPRARG